MTVLRWLGRVLADPLVLAVIVCSAFALIGGHLIADRLDAMERCARADRPVLQVPDERTAHIYIGSPEC